MQSKLNTIVINKVNLMHINTISFPLKKKHFNQINLIKYAIIRRG